MKTSSPTLLDYGNGIYALDAGYLRHQFAAIHLIVDHGRAAFVDCGANSSLPRAEAALAALGLAPEAVDYVLLTHIHLDHAGGAGAMMRAFPQAKLVVHPRGARHMIAPAKLWAATEEVYGKATARELYGELIPVPAERVVEADDGLELRLGARTLSFHDCPGHARHHVFIHDHAARGVFTGDTFGISYRECDVDGRAFLFPSSTPSQFDPVAMRDSIQRMLACDPEAMYLTHYSRLTPPAELGREVLRRLDDVVALARAVAEKLGGESGVSRGIAPRPANGPAEGRHSTSEAGGTAREGLVADLQRELTAYLRAEAHAHGVTLPDARIEALWRTDMELDAQGLAVWLGAAD